MKIQGEFTVDKWDEKKIGGSAEKPVSSVSAVFSVSGGLTGKLNVEYVMYFTYTDKDDPHNSKAIYTGYMLFDGTINGKSGGKNTNGKPGNEKINGKSGSFAAEDKGEYTPAGPKSGLSIIPGSGAGGLKSISGKGGYGFKDGKMIIEFNLK